MLCCYLPKKKLMGGRALHNVAPPIGSTRNIYLFGLWIPQRKKRKIFFLINLKIKKKKIWGLISYESNEMLEMTGDTNHPSI